MTTIAKWCAVCGEFTAHTITRESVDGLGRDFIVTKGMCDGCIERSNTRWATIKETLDRTRRSLT